MLNVRRAGRPKKVVKVEDKSCQCIECGKPKDKKLYIKTKNKYCSRKCALRAFKRSHINKVPNLPPNWINHRQIQMVMIAGKLREVTSAR